MRLHGVIFDEVHYMQDRERGVVWEEAIIFLPQGVQLVFLSAFLSNATDFAAILLCRGSEVLREVAWVIFDEVHYMQDRERGVVWEEAIIFLPKGVRMVFLSATLSNATEFAGWVCNLHKQICHLVYTDFRATLLLHYAFLSGGSGLYLVSSMLASHSHPCACVWPCHLQPCPMPLFAG